MERPSKKDIKAAVDKLKNKSSEKSEAKEQNASGKLSDKKSSQRIRKGRV